MKVSNLIATSNRKQDRTLGAKRLPKLQKGKHFSPRNKLGVGPTVLPTNCGLSLAQLVRHEERKKSQRLPEILSRPCLELRNMNMSSVLWISDRYKEVI